MTHPSAAPETVEAPAVPTFAELAASAAGISAGAPLDLLYDLSLPIAIEFGRTHMTVQEVLQLGRGSVIQLERMAGEPIDVYVSNKKLAEGEVVVIGENFGVRITRLVGAPSAGGR